MSARAKWSEHVRAWRARELSFTDKVGLVVDREWVERENRRLDRLLKAAKLPMEASLEDVWCTQGRGLTKAQIRELAQAAWIRHHHNVIVIGKTGCGKSSLGAALAQAACPLGYHALYTRVPRLAHELTISRADGSYVNKLTNLAKLDVLVLDDFLIAPLKDTERRDLLEVLEDRYDRKSTVSSLHALCLADRRPRQRQHMSVGVPKCAGIRTLVKCRDAGPLTPARPERELLLALALPRILVSVERSDDVLAQSISLRPLGLRAPGVTWQCPSGRLS